MSNYPYCGKGGTYHMYQMTFKPLEYGVQENVSPTPHRRIAKEPETVAASRTRSSRHLSTPIRKKPPQSPKKTQKTKQRDRRSARTRSALVTRSVGQGL